MQREVKEVPTTSTFPENRRTEDTEGAGTRETTRHGTVDGRATLLPLFRGENQSRTAGTKDLHMTWNSNQESEEKKRF